MKCLGIDFGTTYTKAAIYNDGVIKPVLFNGVDTQMPSVVLCHMDDPMGVRLVGRKAINERFNPKARLIDDFKLELFDESNSIADFVIPYDELVKDIFNEVLRNAGGRIYDKYVVTVPAETIEGDFRWKTMLSAASKSGIPRNKLSIIKEPEAAGYYVLHKLMEEKEPVENKHIMIYDNGGGTFDGALMTVEDGMVQLVSPSRGDNIGGHYMDLQIRRDMVDQSSYYQKLIAKSEDEDLYDSSRPDYINFLREQSKLKEQPRIVKESICMRMKDFQDLNYHLTVDDFNKLIETNIDDSIGVCERIVDNSGLEWKDVDYVFLVGGSSNIPLVGEKWNTKRKMTNARFHIIKNVFKNSKLEYMNAVAYGAALYNSVFPDNLKLCEIASKLIDKGDYGRAYEYYEKAGHCAGYFGLGMMSYKGLGVKKSMRTAIDCFEYSQLHKDDGTSCPDNFLYGADFMLALMYFKGEGYGKDDKKALAELDKIKVTSGVVAEKVAVLRAAINGNVDNAIYEDDFYRFLEVGYVAPVNSELDYSKLMGKLTSK